MKQKCILFVFQIPSTWYAEQHARQENIKQICTFYVNDEYKFLYCKIPKVASSTFVTIFLYLAGITNSTSVNASRLYENENLHSRLVTLNKLSESEATWRLSNYSKFFSREILLLVCILPIRISLQMKKIKFIPKVMGK